MLDLVTLAIEHALGALDGAGGVGGAGGVAGDVLEAGVWRGGTSIVAAATPPRTRARRARASASGA